MFFTTEITEDTEKGTPVIRLRLAVCCVALIAASGCSVGWQPYGPVPGGYRRNLDGDPSRPGPFRFELKVPAGARIEAHKHNIDVHARVLSGTMFIIIGEPLQNERARKYPAGSTFVVPADTWHIEWWDDPTVVEGRGFGPMKTTRR